MIALLIHVTLRDFLLEAVSTRDEAIDRMHDLNVRRGLESVWGKNGVGV